MLNRRLAIMVMGKISIRPNEDLTIGLKVRGGTSSLCPWISVVTIGNLHFTSITLISIGHIPVWLINGLEIGTPS